MKAKKSSSLLAILMSALMAFTLVPTIAFANPGGNLVMGAMADDSNYTVEARADATNGDVTKAEGNVTPKKLINGNAYGVYATAESEKTATVTVADISLNLPSADFGYGVAAYAGDLYSTKTSGHISVTTGNVTSYADGVRVYADYVSDAIVTVNGDVKAGAYDGSIWGLGVYAEARDGGQTSVTVNGNVVASQGLMIDSAEFDNQRRATAGIVINGDVTAADGYGAKFMGASPTQDVLVTGTISGSTYGVITDTCYFPATGANKLTVWRVVVGSGKAEDLFVVATSYNTYEADDDSAKSANYIVKASKGVTPLAADGSALAESHGYPVAKEGDKILITAANGNVVTKAYNNGIEITTKDADGNFYYTVPRGGGIDLSAEIGDQPAVKTKKISAPVGKTLTYNGKTQVGVVAGTGYTLSGTYKATKAGTYSATATLKSGYAWSDGTTAAKKVSWKIGKAANKLSVKAKTTKKKPLSAKEAKTTKFAVSKYAKVSNPAKGKLTYKKTSGNKKITVNKKNGKLTVPKGFAKKTYRVKVTVTSAATTNYKSASKPVTLYVKVK